FGQPRGRTADPQRGQTGQRNPLGEHQHQVSLWSSIANVRTPAAFNGCGFRHCFPQPLPHPCGRCLPQSLAYGRRTTARALVSPFVSPDRALSASATRFPSSLCSTCPLTLMLAPESSSGTTTGAENLTPNSSTIAFGPAQSVTKRAASAIVNMPCAITSGGPTALAIRSLR